MQGLSAVLEASTSSCISLSHGHPGKVILSDGGSNSMAGEWESSISWAGLDMCAVLALKDERITQCGKHMESRCRFPWRIPWGSKSWYGNSALPGKSRGYGTCPFLTGGGTTAFAKGLLCGSIAAVSGGCFEMFRWKGWWLSGCDPLTKLQSYYRNLIIIL